MTVEGFIKLNDMKKQFNFLRYLDSKHQYGSWKPSEYTGILGKREGIKKELMNHLKEFSRNKKVDNNQTSKELEKSTKS